MGEVLVAVKNNKLFQTLADACRDRGHGAARALTLEEAEKRLAQEAYIALIVNLDDLPTGSEKKIAARIRGLPGGLKILGLAAGAGLKTVTGYFRAGLADFLSLPPDPLELAQALNNVLGSLEGTQADGAARPAPLAPRRQPGAESPPPPAAGAPQPAGGDPGPAALQAPGQAARPASAAPSSARAIVGTSPALMKLFRIIGKVAATDSTVMVHGETGTGKELIARAIHLSSARRDKPMIPVNCGAIPEELLETELFGHEKGAFTNAVKERAGRFELAQGGTVFLDEIGDMSPKLQVKLLRVLQEHEFEKVGGERTIRADIRVITATHVDLAQAVREGRFREDLYYRLNVIPVSVPSLRERSEDIPLLVDYFLKRLREIRGSTVTGVTPSALSQLCSYRWPGNIRELENLMERMVILADGDVLTDDDLPAWIRSAPEPQDEARNELLRGFLEQDGAPTAGGEPEGCIDPGFEAPCGPEGAADPGDTPGRPGSGGGGRPGSGDDALTAGGRIAPSGARPGDGENGSLGGETIFGTDYAGDTPGGCGQIPPPPASDRPAEGGGGGCCVPAAGTLPDGLRILVAPLLEFPVEGVSLNALMKDYEGRLIDAALRAADGYRNSAARLLGINRTTLQEKLRKK
jgi:DNA-binding NtrC family response regulator